MALFTIYVDSIGSGDDVEYREALLEVNGVRDVIVYQESV